MILPKLDSRPLVQQLEGIVFELKKDESEVTAEPMKEQLKATLSFMENLMSKLKDQ